MEGKVEEGWRGRWKGGGEDGELQRKKDRGDD